MVGSKSYNYFVLFATIFLLSGVVKCNKEVQIVIIGSNDIHGSAFPTLLRRSDTNETYKYGGLEYMGRLIEIIKNEYPNRSIYLDAGDQFQGGIQSSQLISSGMIMNDFYNAMGLQGAAIGNHEFDFGPEFLFPFYQTRRVDNLAANLRSEVNKVDFMPRQKNSKIFTLDQGIKIGVIGLATLETPSTTAGFSKGLFPPYKFLQYRDIILEEARSLRKQNVDAVIILSHVGNDCPQKIDYGFYSKDNFTQACPKDQITNLIDALPAGTIDAIVQGHRHRIVHHFYKGIPFMGSINGGYYFNVMHIRFQISGTVKKTKRITSIVIEGPIPVCEKVFSKLWRCNYLSAEQLKEKDPGQLIPWSFHNKQVYAHPAIQTIYQNEWFPKMQPYFEEICNNQVYLNKIEDQESELGNLLSNLIHETDSEADFVIVNPGSFRTVWLPGVIQYQHVYGMCPFTNIIQRFKISGSELKQMLEILQVGNKGFYSTWNLKNTVNVTRDDAGVIKSIKYVSGSFYNETQFEHDAQYTGLSIDFLLQGGDDFKDVINKVYTPRGVENVGDLRDAYKIGLQKLGTIQAGTLIDPEHPRLVINQNK